MVTSLKDMFFEIIIAALVAKVTDGQRTLRGSLEVSQRSITRKVMPLGGIILKSFYLAMVCIMGITVIRSIKLSSVAYDK